MFVYDFIVIDRPFAAVRSMVLDAEPEVWLRGLALHLHEDSVELHMRVGPRLGGSMAKEVRIELGRHREHEGSVLVPVRWEATGPSSLFPAMEADLSFAEFEPVGTYLSFHGNYDPPLGLLGREMNRLLLHRVAEGSVRSFLQRIARYLETGGSEAEEDSLEGDTAPTRPGDQR